MRFVVIGLLLSGCLYLDPIVERPSVIVSLVEPVGTFPSRGGSVTVAAQYQPARSDGTYRWSAYACVGEDGHDDCSTPFATGDQSTWQFRVPLVVSGTSAPVQGIFVKLEARDDRGVLAQAATKFPVLDQPPTLELRKTAHSFTVGAPIELFAKFGDPDDPADGLTVEWKVFTPNSQPTYTLDNLAMLPDDLDPVHVTVGKRFVAHGPGDWDIQVIARDRLGQMIERHLLVAVAPDRPPCLAQWQPIVPPDGGTLPVADPTVFQIPVVDDDLDARPPVLGDPAFGTTAFAWSILPPLASVRQPLVGTTGNSVDFDPAAFTPGDVVELRVEIFDRNHTAIPCLDSAPTCSVISQPGCIQRLTWRVEVR